MRRKLLTILAMGLFILVAASTSNATLITDNGNGVVYDTQTQTYWYQDLSQFTGMTYAQQISEISSLGAIPSLGIAGWSMATKSELESFFDFYPRDKIANAFIPTAVGGSWQKRWWGRYDSPLSNGAYHEIAGINLTNQGVYNGNYSSFTSAAEPNDLIGAWVVATTTVPEPSTLLLFGAGIASLAGIRQRRKRSRKTPEGTSP